MCVQVCVPVHVCARSLTEDENSVAKRLGAVGLHGDVQDGGISPNDADTVVLLCLAEHSQQLIGDNPVQCRYGQHGYHKGQKCIHLYREETQEAVNAS